ncbi:hypothetical protein SK128_013629 [Halocaridina rubra]|uniref:Uncharacterized protein n=1 Tax=Halocaridina rubra TaxID=373956 RepID=A0AAN8WV92_HALRR
MSGLRLKEESVSGVFCHSLGSESFVSMLKQYRRLLLSTYGPRGSIILVSNSVGRNALVSTSSSIIKEVSFAHPCVKYINALISAQNASCGLSGLYCGILCSGLLIEAIELEEEEVSSHHLIADVFEWIISQTLTLLAQFPSQVVTSLDIGDMHQVTAFVRAIVGSKSCINLSEAEKNDLGLHIVKAFLKSIPNEVSSSKFEHVNILHATSSTAINVFDGMLYGEPDTDQKLLEKISLLPKDINILLFAVPLQASSDTAENVHWRGKLTKEEVFNRHILPSLELLVKERNLHVIANQKSIHPIIKFELGRLPCIVLERLGTAATDTLIKLSGCQAITDLTTLTGELNSSVFGKLSSVQHVVINEKAYLQLKRENNNLSTLLLPAVSPNVEETLKEITESCFSALKMGVVDEKVVAGAGCLESWLAFQVGHLIVTNMDSVMSLTGASKHCIIKVADGFIKVYMELAIHVGKGSTTTKFDWCVDSIFHHLWHAEDPEVLQKNVSSDATRDAQYKCVCGLITREMIKQKYDGTWYPLDFRLNRDMMKSSSESHCLCNKLSVEEVLSRSKDQNQRASNDSKFSDNSNGFGMDADSLEEKASVEEDEDSLEKTLNGLQGDLEDECDSLEGILQNLKNEGDMDSLEDVLDSFAEPPQDLKNNCSNVHLNTDLEGAIYDCYLAKYNAMRLAVEGFSQLFQIGQCVFDA